MRFNKEKIDTWFESEEGQKAFDRWALKIEKEELQEKRNFNRICKIIDDIGLEVFIEKCVSKYKSDEYVFKEYRCGYQPREDLLYYLYQYFEKFGLKTSEYTNMFMDCTYSIDDYYVGMMVGQGTAIKVYKKD